MNVTESYDLDHCVTAYARIDSLLDRYYQCPIGFLHPGIGVFAGVRATIDKTVWEAEHARGGYRRTAIQPQRRMEADGSAVDVFTLPGRRGPTAFERRAERDGRDRADAA